MAGTLRALRRRIRSTQSTKKIFSAQELIAGARIVRAQARVEASKPYAREITRVLSALASSASLSGAALSVMRRWRLSIPGDRPWRRGNGKPGRSGERPGRCWSPGRVRRS